MQKKRKKQSLLVVAQEPIINTVKTVRKAL